MAWYAVYKIGDGELQSVGQSVASANDLSAKGFSSIELLDRPNPSGWNTATLVFDPVPVARKPLSVESFYDLFTDDEFDNIVAARTGTDLLIAKKVNSFITRLNAISDVSLDSQRVIDGINLLETAGLIGVGRAAEILV